MVLRPYLCGAVNSKDFSLSTYWHLIPSLKVAKIQYNLKQITDVFTLQNKKMDEEEHEWKIPLLIGKIKTLQGNCRLELGQLKEAYEYFINAMTLYGYPFPTNRRLITLYVACLELKHNIGLYLFPKLMYSFVDGFDEAEFCDNVSECLSLLCNLFIVSVYFS